MKKVFKKIIIVLFLIGITSWISVDVYIYNCWRKKTSPESLSIVCDKINATKPFPDKIIEAYDRVYPDASEREVSPDILSIIINDSQEKAPSLQIAYRFYHCGRPELNSLANQIEKRCSIRKCIECYLTKSDYYNQCVGVSSASEFYFKKNLNDLNEEECLSLIVMSRNPSLYNPLRNPEKLKIKVNEIMKR
ncbi:MAG: transglycosylase domain-containing protein [Bacteroidia bacterium]|nr:transglycosylase domain-containing protein [Bacteroidia bacterium]